MRVALCISVAPPCLPPICIKGGCIHNSSSVVDTTVHNSSSHFCMKVYLHANKNTLRCGHVVVLV